MSVERLETLLAEATPGPWSSLHEEEPPHWISVLDHEHRPVFHTAGGSVAREHVNADLAALAPTLARLVIDMAAELRHASELLNSQVWLDKQMGTSASEYEDAAEIIAALLGRVDALNEQAGR